jgi:hypothetical protein
MENPTLRTSLKTLIVAGAAFCLALGAATPAVASPATHGNGGTLDKLVGVVRITSPTTALVQAQYRCTGDPSQLHLWVSVKQAADRKADQWLSNPGTGGGVDEQGKPLPGPHAAAWSQSHSVSKLICNGHTHVAKFKVDQSEQGYGVLKKGEAWVQFCLFDKYNQQAPVSSMEFRHVR